MMMMIIVIMVVAKTMEFFRFRDGVLVLMDWWTGHLSNKPGQSSRRKFLLRICHREKKWLTGQIPSF